MRKEEAIRKARRRRKAVGRQWERLLAEQGFHPAAGVDEVGRGCLAGPVIAAAVVLPARIRLHPWLDDSKRLQPHQRSSVCDWIVSLPGVAYGIGLASAQEVDRWNVLAATMLAMARAVLALRERPGIVLVDGRETPPVELPARAIVGGDGRCACIAAASILAKVTRDRWMEAVDRDHPQFGFARHKGYGTALHWEALRLYGTTSLHRQSFLGRLSEGRIDNLPWEDGADSGSGRA
ncbi:ribonuclease HII [Methylacidimicrobium tartarophylax]|uniref:Ribonuclease HII n=1 Tax=Methylacidimicrobium tartarophylax TaxID=1041768 RepID=A0A5E6MJU1_9BACT|nr:ribonuclease HII [Methylacidimicrobium tartarophylax]VVM08225.1 Ribonuclease HII [Methylacidimicrobium tartarophylax]